MRFHVDAQQWVHPIEVERLTGWGNVRDEDMPPSLRKLLAKFREDIENLERQRDLARSQLAVATSTLRSLAGEHGNRHGVATVGFLRDLRDLDLGFGCDGCGYLESEHHIDGDERAPCNDFRSAGTAGRGDE